MGINAERLSQKLVVVPTSLMAGILSASVPAEVIPPEFTPAEVYVPDIRNVEVHCVNIGGFKPFTEEECARLADNAQAGITQFSDLTENVIEPPDRFTHRIVPEIGHIDNALPTRCTNLTIATPFEAVRTRDIADAATSMVMRNSDIRPDTGVIVAVNSPVADCGVTPGKLEPWLAPPTDRCIPEPPDKVGYFAAGAMVDQARHATVFTFTGEETPLGNIVKQRDIAHEWGHVARYWLRLGHEFGLCALNSDQLPVSIDREQVAELQPNIRIWRGSLMSYSRNYDENTTYIAPPHLAYLGVIPDNRIIEPQESGIFTLGDIRGNEPALLQIDLTSQAVKDIVRPLLPPFVAADDYRIWVGKLSRHAATPEVGVYAAPIPEKSSVAPIVLLSILQPGGKLELENDMQLTVVDAGQHNARVNLQLANTG